MPSYKTPFKVCIFKKTFSRQERCQTEKRFPGKRGSEGIKACMLVFGKNGMDREIPGHRKKNLAELKLDAET